MWGGSRLSVRNTFINVMSGCGSSQPDGKWKGGAASVSAINEGGVARLQPMLDARASERIVDEDDGQSSVASDPSPSCQMHCIECASEDPNGWGKPDRDFWCQRCGQQHRLSQPSRSHPQGCDTNIPTKAQPIRYEHLDPICDAPRRATEVVIAGESCVTIAQLIHGQASSCLLVIGTTLFIDPPGVNMRSPLLRSLNRASNFQEPHVEKVSQCRGGVDYTCQR